MEMEKQQLNVHRQHIKRVHYQALTADIIDFLLEPIASGANCVHDAFYLAFTTAREGTCDGEWFVFYLVPIIDRLTGNLDRSLAHQVIGGSIIPIDDFDTERQGIVLFDDQADGVVVKFPL